MKKFILSILTTICLVFDVFAQQPCISFMGIPVDGDPVEVVNKLLDKGFTYAGHDKGSHYRLSGYFNGNKSNVYVCYYNNTVHRIMVCDSNTSSEAYIKIQFNKLITTFNNNAKYTASENNSYISNDDDISYNMRVKDKLYDALYIYNFSDWLLEYENFIKSLNKEEIAAQLQNIFSTYENVDTREFDIKVMYNNFISTENNVDLSRWPSKDHAFAYMIISTNIHIKKLEKTQYVWFRICEYGSEYYITYYYDNEDNKTFSNEL